MMAVHLVRHGIHRCSGPCAVACRGLTESACLCDIMHTECVRSFAMPRTLKLVNWMHLSMTSHYCRTVGTPLRCEKPLHHLPLLRSASLALGESKPFLELSFDTKLADEYRCILTQQQRQHCLRPNETCSDCLNSFALLCGVPGHLGLMRHEQGFCS